MVVLEAYVKPDFQSQQHPLVRWLSVLKSVSMIGRRESLHLHLGLCGYVFETIVTLNLQPRRAWFLALTPLHLFGVPDVTGHLPVSVPSSESPKREKRMMPLDLIRVDDLCVKSCSEGQPAFLVAIDRARRNSHLWEEV